MEVVSSIISLPGKEHTKRWVDPSHSGYSHKKNSRASTGN